MLYILAKILLTPIAWLVFRPRVKGFSKLFFRGKAIIVSNHWALTDPILLAIICPRAIHFMAKRELFTTPVKRFFMGSLFAFPVDREHADVASLKHAAAVLDEGRVFGIFPEGKRSITGELDDIEKGAAFLALRCGAPIIPIYSDPNTFKRLRIRMLVGEPINASEIIESRKGKQLDMVTNAIANSLRGLRAEMEAM